MPARNVVSNSSVRYSRLATDDDGYIDLQVNTVTHCYPTGVLLVNLLLFVLEVVIFVQMSLDRGSQTPGPPTSGPRFDVKNITQFGPLIYLSIIKTANSCAIYIVKIFI